MLEAYWNEHLATWNVSHPVACCRLWWPLEENLKMSQGETPEDLTRAFCVPMCVEAYLLTCDPVDPIAAM